MTPFAGGRPPASLLRTTLQLARAFRRSECGESQMKCRLRSLQPMPGDYRTEERGQEDRDLAKPMRPHRRGWRFEIEKHGLCQRAFFLGRHWHDWQFGGPILVALCLQVV